MATLDILVYPDDTLKQVSEVVTDFNDEFRRFVADLDETRLHAPGCVGIAAPQVGRFQRVAIVDVSANPRHKSHGLMILVNPEITAWNGFVKGREGCLSVPDYTGNVMRAETITLEAQDPHGEMHEYHCEGFEARAVQHEIDHLDGLLFLDRLVSRRKDLFQRKVYKK
ncbi:peptide deformylase [Sulfuriflexus sp.]|uniref:peptide deformylase n=1 Tax=Sulfuriflexus sp. TaxID=2015443 RepID=UPI0028CE2450|nr:peptide deformylase [Sulfuriflexus sp.]MDT8404594.1 peptide deformylase [Sulfuriflexus sp.]